MAAMKLFYYLKPLIPRRLQLMLRRVRIRRQLPKYASVWPVLEKAGKAPDGWRGWPEDKEFAVVLTHDVESASGHDKCEKLMEMEKNAGFRSSFNFVPERYKVSPELRDLLTKNGFEVGVHGLKHDGKLYQSKEEFLSRAVRINRYLRDWKAAGFRSPAMHHNLEWLHHLNIKYDLSTFDTDPFEPQSDGVETIFPFRVFNPGSDSSYLEFPYTLAQDFTVFILMQEKSIDIWRKKTDWIAEKKGMVLVNVHPDYMNFESNDPGLEDFPAGLYLELLEYIKTKYKDRYLNVLPGELAAYMDKQETATRKSKINAVGKKGVINAHSTEDHWNEKLH
ncbi:MAG: hypothetical protein AB7T22_08170 [Calditrichaceae bacterium]